MRIAKTQAHYLHLEEEKKLFPERNYLIQFCSSTLFKMGSASKKYQSG